MDLDFKNHRAQRGRRRAQDAASARATERCEREPSDVLGAWFAGSRRGVLKQQRGARLL